ncbi:fluoroquinolone export ABC transporter permease subunit [Hyphomonas sp.]|uniref:fluoroquinolone export ABC transporter permease subunit n=1 Tax=Hyphomonas sp. TaxID=87 RepID=UPI003F711BBA
MTRLLSMIRWDVTLQARNHIYIANILSTLAIIAFVVLLPLETLPVPVASFFIFTDPALIGLSFIGAIVMMEKASRVLSALGVTPAPPSTYVASKTITMSLNGLLAGLAVAWFALDGAFDWPLMILALTLSNVVAVLLGFAIVARAPSMNGLMIYLLFASTIIFAPLLAHFGFVPAPAKWVFAIIPSYAMLMSFNGAADPDLLSLPEWTYALGYQVIWIIIGWLWAMGEFKKSIISEGR